MELFLPPLVGQLVQYNRAYRQATFHKRGAMNVQERARMKGHVGVLDHSQAEGALTLEARLAATYEHVGAGIVEIDRDGRMLRVNQELCELTGYSRQELLGRTIFQETVPEDVEADLQQFNRQLAGEIDRYTIEKRIYRRDGSHFWAEVKSSSVRDAEDRFLYAVRVQHDITD